MVGLVASRDIFNLASSATASKINDEYADGVPLVVSTLDSDAAGDDEIAELFSAASPAVASNAESNTDEPAGAAESNTDEPAGAAAVPPAAALLVVDDLDSALTDAAAGAGLSAFVGPASPAAVPNALELLLAPRLVEID